MKEHWWPLDSSPTHSWMRWLYRYPQAEFPYTQLREENANRTRDDPEYELVDTGVLAEDRFFDVEITYGKATPEDRCIQWTVTNAGPGPAPPHRPPTGWSRHPGDGGRGELADRE